MRLVFQTILISTLLFVSSAVARPGGGHSYSGGGFSRGLPGGGFRGGFGSSGGWSHSWPSGPTNSWNYPANSISFATDNKQLLFILCVVVLIFLILSFRKNKKADWNSRKVAPKTASLSIIKQTDPLFSEVLFFDFMYALLPAVYESFQRGQKQQALTPYVTKSIFQAIQKRFAEATKISHIAVGSIQPVSVEEHQDNFQVTLDIEINLTVHSKETITYYTRERWMLFRQTAAQTKARHAATTLGCPNCGANFETTKSNRCDYCEQVVNNGLFDWYVKNIEVLSETKQGPNLISHVPERGTNMPTRAQFDVDDRWLALHKRDPAFTTDAINARLRLIYERVNTTWNRQDLRPSRPYISDSLYNYLSYWITAYQEQSLVNKIDDATLYHWTPVKITTDSHFDAVTVRIWAGGKDYTTDSSGQPLFGSAKKARDYSEYWTLIRGVSAQGSTKATSDPACPHCGQTMEVNMAGNCVSCGAHLTRGEFDWVLSRIEQDESYRG